MTHRSQSLAGWQLVAEVGQGTLAEDWRDALPQMLGYRPRRLGLWTELALYGALSCLHAAGESQLPARARLRLASLAGPAQAQEDALAQFGAGLLMPFTFIQAQPALTLASLAQALQWQGDAAFVVATEPRALTSLCLHGAGAEGLLLGVVEATGALQRSHWQRWMPSP